MKTGWLAKVLIVAFVVGFEALQDVWVHLWFLSMEIPPSTSVLDDLLTGGLLGLGLLLILIKVDRAKEESLIRSRMIAEMNHHVRNALQIIEYSTHAREKTEQMQAIHEAVQRIDWALKEVLPSDCREHVEFHHDLPVDRGKSA